MQKIQDPQRLEALQALGLLDTPSEEAFDRLTQLATLITGSPVSLVSLVDADRQFFKSSVGLPEPFASARETPLSHSFCQYVVEDASPLVVEDARQHPILKDNEAIPDLNVIAYLGMPLTTSEGVDLGAFCVIDHKPRQWTANEIKVMHELAKTVITEIELRAQVKARQKAENALRRQINKYERAYMFIRNTLHQMQERVEQGAEAKEILGYLKAMQNDLRKIQS